MNQSLLKDEVVDLHNDTKFEKLASFANKLTEDEQAADIASLLEKQSYADDATYADPMNRMFSIASPVETKLSALYAEKCASLLSDDVINRINDACRIYNIDIEVPHVEKAASILEDKEIVEAVKLFDENYVDPEEMYNSTEKYASCDQYGNQLDNCLAARAYYATSEEDVEAIENLAKVASRIEPAKMVSLLQEIDEELGLDSAHMQSLVGTPEYAVYEKVASENMVTLTPEASVPLAIIEENKDVLSDMGVDLDWDGEDENALTLQIEHLPSQIKEELASCCGK